MGEVEKTDSAIVEPEHQENEETDSDSDYDPQFEPLIHLPVVNVQTLEEDEEVLWKHRASLYRYDDSEEPAQWKQRGTGVIKLLKHKELGYVRVLMRRDVTLKVCANHYILPYFQLRQHDKSDRAWVWFTPADFADEEPKKETLAIRFKDLETFHEFHEYFEKSKAFMKEYQEKMMQKLGAGDEGDGENKVETPKEEDTDTKLAKEVETLSVA